MIDIKLLIATTNQGKAKEISAYLEGLPLSVTFLLELNSLDIYEEDSLSFLENTRGKSLFYGRKWEGLTLGEDSGLAIDCLQGAPGVRSARFSDPGATDEKNIAKVLKLMEDVPEEERKARFVSCLVLSQKGKILAEITGETRGVITSAKKGRFGFGYDPIFYYPPLDRTFAELSPEEKNAVSHRGQALKQLKAFLQTHCNWTNT
ncbi:MAG: RdgB/HAM1 family non-canonical purine NTP pyrophosphatase [Candidatus Aminicenantaceae bacterium]